MNNNIWQLKLKEKICCFDLDGVLMSCYPDCWVAYVNKILSTNFKDLNVIKKTISYDAYRELKEQYRLSGVKETFPADTQASFITKKLKEKGYSILIMTARPANKYPCLYKQTLNWLRKNKITFDGIYFEEKNKHSKIVSEIPHLKFMIEDNSFFANQIGQWGYKCFLLKNKYNENLKLGKNVVMIKELNEILKYI